MIGAWLSETYGLWFLLEQILLGVAPIGLFVQLFGALTASCTTSFQDGVPSLAMLCLYLLSRCCRDRCHSPPLTKAFGDSGLVVHLLADQREPADIDVA